MKMREEALELQEENIALRHQVSDLERFQDLRASLKFDGTVYWQLDETEEEHGPFCQRCFDIDKLLVRLQDGTYHDGDRYVKLWDCAACKTTYTP